MKNLSRFKWVISLLLFALPFSSYAQITPDQVAQGKEILEEKDIPQDEVRAKLLERGIDPDNIPPEKIPEMEGILQQIIAEIQAEKGLETEEKSEVGFQESTVQEESISADNAQLENETEILEDIAAGASLEEAISEELSEETVASRDAPAIFGHHIFYNNSVSVFRTTESPFVPDNYVLDVGDQIAITIFGASQADVTYEIEKDGFIRPSNLPKIYLKGLHFSKAKSLLRNRFRQAYSFNSDQINITLQTARTITVNIYGEINVPGSYTISALNNAVNAIMAAGGVNENGSVRQIQIIRNGRIQILDLYDFINKPSKKVDFHLENNDILFIPIVQNVVSIGGAVKRPEKYEVIENESFIDLVEMANGFNPNADLTLMNTTSFQGNVPIHKDVELQPILTGNIKWPLKNGETYYIRGYTRGAEDYVRISGAVDFSGNYALTEGMRVSDLVKKARLDPYALLDFAYIYRQNPDETKTLVRVDLDKAVNARNSEQDIELQKFDHLAIYRTRDYTESYRVSIKGAVRQPVKTFWSADKGMTVYDLINLSGGLKNTAADFGYIMGTSSANHKNKDYRFINVKALVANPSSTANVLLKPNDQVFVFENSTFSDDYVIKVKGAVRRETSVPYSNNLTLRHLLAMAEGLRPEAASNKIDIFRLEIQNDESTRVIAQTVEIDHDFNPLDPNTVLDLKPNDVVVVRYSPEFEPMKFIELKGEVKYPGTYALLHDNETVAELIERAGGLTQEAYVTGATMTRSEDIQGKFVVDIEKALKNRSSKFNIALKEGDEIFVPKILNHVSIGKDGTNASLSYTQDIIGEDGLIHLGYQGRKSARWYINNFSGGFSDDAIKRSTQVIRANGQIKKTRSFLSIKIYPRVNRGSTILVSTKAPKEEKQEDGPSFNGDNAMQTLTNILTLTTTALTTAILAKTL